MANYINSDFLANSLSILDTAYKLLIEAQTCFDTSKNRLSRSGYSTKSLDIVGNIKNIRNKNDALIESLNKSGESISDLSMSTIFSDFSFNFSGSRYSYSTDYRHTILDGTSVNKDGAAALESELGSGNVNVVYYSDLGKIGVRYNQGSHAKWNKTKVDGVSMNEAGCGLISIAGVLTSVISNQNGQITYITPTDLAEDLSDYSKINGGSGLTEYVTNSYGLIGDYDKLAKAISEIYGVSVVVNQNGNLSYDNYECITNSNTGIMYSSKHEAHINAVFGTNNGSVYECDTSSGCANYLNGTKVDPSKRAIYISSQDTINIDNNGYLTMDGKRIDFDIGSVKEIIVNGKTYQLEKDSIGYVVTNQEASTSNYLKNQNKEVISGQTIKLDVEEENVSEIKDLYTEILSSEEAIVKTKESALRLRAAPGTDSEVLKRLSKGTTILATGQSEIDENGVEWIEVIDGNKNKGWVSKNYIELKDGSSSHETTVETPTTELPSESPIETKGYVDITSGHLNVRLEPNGEIIGSLSDNAEIKIIEQGTDGWTKIEIDGKEAYVYSDYIKTEDKVSVSNTSSDPFNMDIAVDIKKTDATISARISANFRKEPGLDSEVLGYLMKDDKITVIDPTPVKGLNDNVEYVLVENSKGERGYVAKCYVEEIEML